MADWSEEKRQARKHVFRNMHMFQAMVELYAIEHGKYLPNVETLYADAIAANPPYWKTIQNPFSFSTDPGKAYADETSPTSARLPGLIAYQTDSAQERYQIWGYDDTDQRIQDNILSGS